ncbi:peptidase A24 [Burkholderia sp. Bp8963]|uniref:A24 family peptidase n=1 Tax=Burkholderia sp. Bp8963 TaxID=2184547 RepID=UPI000F5A0A95|nr:prepilin peptidase [Burkholderia sp. Bp8963]RQS69534.1 peptidase A24 [Burkholderia sp. Bp8963]
MLPAMPSHPIPLCVATLVIVAASSDITSRRIPNRLVAIGVAGALIAQCVLHGIGAGATAWLAGAATGFFMLLPFYLLRGMAAGDVKLMLAVGAWVGPALTVYIAVATFIAGGVGALAMVIWQGRMRQLFANMRVIAIRAAVRGQGGASVAPVEGESVGALPYGVAIALGTLSMLFAASAASI